MITNSPYQSHLFMNNIQVAIIEDEKPAARLLEGMIKKLRPQWDIIKIPGSIESSVAWFASHPHPDIVFLDIQLSDGNSFLFIEQACPTSLIIFTTAYDEYAVRAFTVNSIDYLLKPIRQERLEEAIQKFEHVTSKYNQKLLEQNDLLEVLHSLTYPGKKYRTRFLISGNEKLITLQVEDIAHFYSLNKITFAVTRQNKEYIIDFPQGRAASAAGEEALVRYFSGIAHRLTPEQRQQFSQLKDILLAAIEAENAEQNQKSKGDNQNG